MDVKPLSNLQEDNDGLPLLRLANPRGIVPALSTLPLDWYFFPLEAKTYDVELEVKYFPAPGDGGEFEDGEDGLGPGGPASPSSSPRRSGRGRGRSFSHSTSRRGGGSEKSRVTMSRQGGGGGSPSRQSSRLGLGLSKKGSAATGLSQASLLSLPPEPQVTMPPSSCVGPHLNPRLAHVAAPPRSTLHPPLPVQP